jgi:phosphate starvation-inducible protein PhoH
MPPGRSSEELLLEPVDNARLANLAGQLDEHLRLLERRLGIEINHRGNRFRLIGEADTVAVAARVLAALYATTAAQALTPELVHLQLQQAGVDQLLEQSLLPRIADRLLDAMASGEPITRVHATLDGEGALACEFA